MKLGFQNKLFGTLLRTRALMYLAAMEETYPVELARTMGAAPFPVQRLLDSLETEGVVVSRKLGLERRFTLNRRFFGSSELRSLLLKMGQADAELQNALAQRRTRPRRKGKPL